MIFQAKTEVLPTDTPEMVAEKVHALEYEHFPKVANIVKFGTGLSNLQKRLEIQKIGDLTHQILEDKMVFIIEMESKKWK